MNLLKDVLHLKGEHESLSKFVYVGVMQELSIVLHDICDVKSKLKDLENRVSKLESKHE